MPRSVRTIYLLRQVQLAAQVRLEDVLRAPGLTPAQYTVLSLSGGQGPGPSSADLARRAGVSAQSMNEIIGALESKGLIHRQEALENRRILRIRLTEQGASLLSRCERLVDRAETGLLATLSPPEVEVLRGLLRKVLDPRSEARLAG